MMEHGEPICVRQGERPLFRLLKASASMGISLALAGHRFTVIALDGNPVQTPVAVSTLELDVAERVDAIVEMNNPGAWILGSTDDKDRDMGMGVVVEYADRTGEPQWIAPPKATWDHTAFGRSMLAPAPDVSIDLKVRAGTRRARRLQPVDHQRQDVADTNPLFTVQRGKRNRLVMNNDSGDELPVHIRRHSFEVTNVGDQPTSGVIKETISMPRFSTAEIDLVVDDPGTLFHCHHQDHMDEGFAGPIVYALERRPIVLHGSASLCPCAPC